MSRRCFTTWGLSSDQAHVFREGTISRWWRIEFSQLPSGRDGQFFAQHCPKHCSDNNPPPSEVIGVAALAHPDLVIEIVAVAALPEADIVEEDAMR